MAKKTAAERKPNLYQLSGHKIQVTYSTSSFEGLPLFHYQDPSQNLQFKGKEIRTIDTQGGTLVAVTLNLTPDLGSTSFTLLVPQVGLGHSDSVHIETGGITTLHKTSIVGPPLQGQ